MDVGHQTNVHVAPVRVDRKERDLARLGQLGGVQARNSQDVGRVPCGQHHAGWNQRDRVARRYTPLQIDHLVGDRGYQVSGLAVFVVNGDDAVPAPRVQTPLPLAQCR